MNSYKKRISTKTELLNQFRKMFTINLFERTLAKLTDGKKPNSVWGKFVPSHYLYKEDSWRKINKDSINYELDLSKVIDHYVFYGFQFPGIPDFIHKLDKDGDVLDIGANIGITTLLFAKHLEGGSGRVVSFEPSKSNFQRLEKHVHLNRFKNIILKKMALGHDRGFSSLAEVLSSNPAMNRIINDTNFYDKKVEKIIISTVDEEISKLKITKINGIKIDVEGYEYKVLLGAEKTLENHKPILHIEVIDSNLKEQGDSSENLLRYLLGLDYHIMDTMTHELINGNSNLENFHSDIICY